MSLITTTFPLSHPKSAAAKKAKALHDQVVQARERVEAAHRTNADAEEAVKVAEGAFDAEVARAAQAGERSSLEGQLAAALSSARVQAEAQIQARRVQAATDAVSTVEGAYLAYCRDHALELLREVSQEADASAENYRNAEAEAEKLLRDAGERRRAAGALVAGVVRVVKGAELIWPDSWDIAEKPAESPLPDAARALLDRAADPEGYDARRRAEIDAHEARLEELEAEVRRAHARARDLLQEMNDLARGAMHGRVPADWFGGSHPVRDVAWPASVEELREAGRAWLDALGEVPATHPAARIVAAADTSRLADVIRSLFMPDEEV